MEGEMKTRKLLWSNLQVIEGVIFAFLHYLTLRTLSDLLAEVIIKAPFRLIV